MVADSEFKDLPKHALERLEGLRSANHPGGVFTSDLTVNEFLLVREAGFEPIGMVVGSSIYHIGFQQANFRNNEELQVLSQAMYHARELAMSRMEEEAQSLGADGVVGVRLEVGRYEWGEDLAEFIAVGTAVAARNKGNYRMMNNKPFTSDLSGQDFWALLRAGYRPLSLVMGSCVYHVAHQSFKQFLRSVGQNCEMPNYTQALYDARELAMERMQMEAHTAKAEGIVGVHLHEKSHGWGSHVIEFFAVGTAVLPTSSDHPIAVPQLVLSLND
ncbi:MAG: heavy metal-binding domain-containing protein [Bacilli bacterium]